MASVTSAGVGSGLDLESIIKATVSAEDTPKKAIITKRKSTLEVNLSGLGVVKGAMSAFQTAIEKLSKPTTFNARTVNINQPSGTTYFTAEASNLTAAGKFNIDVMSLAKGSRAVSADLSFASGNDVVSASGGNLTFAAGSKNFTLAVDPGATLTQLRDSINSSSTNFGVSATIINTGGASPQSRLVLTSNVSGDSNDLTITGSSAEFNKVATTAFGGGAGGMEIALADRASSAKIKVDGIEAVSESNIFTNAIQDMSITVSKETVSGSPITMNVETDKAGVKKSIESFIKAFNDVVGVINEQTAVGGALQGDTSIRTIKNTFIRSLSVDSSASGNIKTLFDMGMKLDKNGLLSLDSTAVNTLDEAMTKSYADIGNFFTSSTGLATVFKKTADTYLATDGVIKRTTDSLNERLRAVQKDSLDHTYRMEQFEKRLREQYTTLDVTIAKMRSTGDYVSAQLSALPGFSKS
jgi:flagellar hook-associated protein 2